MQLTIPRTSANELDCIFFTFSSLLSYVDINDMIAHKFDFSDEELLAYYISFLKSISLKLNERTIVFFFNPVCVRVYVFVCVPVCACMFLFIFVRLCARGMRVYVYVALSTRFLLFNIYIYIVYSLLISFEDGDGISAVYGGDKVFQAR